MTEYQRRTAERLVEILRAQDENPRSWQREAAGEIECLKGALEELYQAYQEGVPIDNEDAIAVLRARVALCLDEQSTEKTK